MTFLRPQPSQRRLPAFPAILLATCALLGCQGPAASPSEFAGEPVLKDLARPSGFLADYSRLRPSPRHPSTLFDYDIDLREFDRFYIEPVVVLPKLAVGGGPISAETAASLAAELKADLVETIQMRYALAETPGPGVARIRAAITQLAESRTDVLTKREYMGGAAIEAEITDSETGRRLLAVAETDSVEAFEPRDRADRLHDARIVFRHWTARLNVFLESVRSGDLPAPAAP